MTFIEKDIEGLPVFELEGKIIGDNETLRLCNRMKELISSGEKNIILDFSKVRWINSPGIGSMISCVMSLRKIGGDLHFVGLGERVGYYFKITKLDTILKSYENTDEVLRKLVSTESPS